ncbi:hypothetical protein ACJX0J_016724 [Zea mays]
MKDEYVRDKLDKQERYTFSSLELQDKGKRNTASYNFGKITLRVSLLNNLNTIFHIIIMVWVILKTPYYQIKKCVLGTILVNLVCKVHGYVIIAATLLILTLSIIVYLIEVYKTSNILGGGHLFYISQHPTIHNIQHKTKYRVHNIQHIYIQHKINIEFFSSKFSSANEYLMIILELFDQYLNSLDKFSSS